MIFGNREEIEIERERESRDFLKNHIFLIVSYCHPDLVYIVIQIIHFRSQRKTDSKSRRKTFFFKRNRKERRYSEIFDSFAKIIISYHNYST